MAETFRAGVIIVVEHPDGRVLACERSDVAGAWQFPQGGIDGGEAPVDAAWRELQEETGLTADEVDLRSESVGWTFYEFPAGHKRLRRHLGQAHRWFRFMAKDEATAPVIDNVEFVNWSWMASSELLDVVAEFRKPGYESMLLSTEAWRDV